jgi:carboxymethylenebutenolidase
VVIVHEVHGLNDNIRDICRRFAGEGYVAQGRRPLCRPGRTICMARLFVDWLAGRLDGFAMGDL